MRRISLIFALALASCYAPRKVTVDCQDAPSYAPHVLRYYYDNQFNIIPERTVYLFEEEVDTIVVFTNTPRKFQTSVVVPAGLPFEDRDRTIQRALDYVLKDKRNDPAAVHQ